MTPAVGFFKLRSGRDPGLHGENERKSKATWAAPEASKCEAGRYDPVQHYWKFVQNSEGGGKGVRGGSHS